MQRSFLRARRSGFGSPAGWEPGDRDTALPEPDILGLKIEYRHAESPYPGEMGEDRDLFTIEFATYF